LRMKWPDWTGRRAPSGDALYRRVVEIARSPDWYLRGEVPDTTDGRFDMVALALAMLLIRLEREDAAQFSVDVTERFIADMDGSLRQLGIGDPTVGKQVGHMVSALGGRLGAYRDALAGGEALRDALARNLYRGAAVDPMVLDWAEQEVRALCARLDATPYERLKAGVIA
jgi:cytochrome b pre-mRNA-processing protein 3